ncbi:MAG: YbaB/EbfC family nucleoid-associated protein [Hyphomicrobiales bacterium]|nr:YbaB/EbfC family nucleoid-associated protein [Hyphomicrobiales bacterium]
MRDLMGMMKKAQELQSKMAEMQAELEDLEVEGLSGAGMVTVKLNGKGAMRGLTIDPSLIKPEEAEILEDLIVAAHNDAQQKVETAMQDKMKEITGGLPLPPGMGF